MNTFFKASKPSLSKKKMHRSRLCLKNKMHRSRLCLKKKSIEAVSIHKKCIEAVSIQKKNF